MDLAGIGLTKPRAEAIRRLASAVTDGELVLDAGADPGEAVQRLESIPGIGPWTAR